MSKELIVSSTPHETKVAILEDDQVVEVYFEREQEYGLAGSVYKGRVTRVLPGMQSAFVDVGLERDAFLYVSDFLEDTEEYEQVSVTSEERAPKMEPERPAAETPAPAPPAPEAPSSASALALQAPSRVLEPTAAASRPDRDLADRGGEGRGRRRSRRHRGRGKGFPESKYAGRLSSVVERPVPPAGPAAPVFPSAAREDEAPPVLPGESVAKYRDWQPPAAPSSELAHPEEPLVESILPAEESSSPEPEASEKPEVPEPAAPASSTSARAPRFSAAA